jgi:hypothetical protein
VRATVAGATIFSTTITCWFISTLLTTSGRLIFCFSIRSEFKPTALYRRARRRLQLDIVMESKGVLTEDGFTIEVAIPFKSLRYEAGKNKQWGLHINRRVKYNNNEYNSWMPHEPQHFRLAQSSRSHHRTRRHRNDAPAWKSIRALREPIGQAHALHFRRRSRRAFRQRGVKGEFGMTAKFSLTPTITLDFAYNPDFAQVEADAPVTTANQRFPIFFAEKRPFFLERIDIFKAV